MLIEMMCSKIHRATITEADLNYIGSITIDKKLMEAAGLLEYQKVQVVDINNGKRFETYVITGDYGSGIICVNGAAARLVHKGDKCIIISYASMDYSEAKSFKPTIIMVDENNSIISP